jgi:hypothetical protein
VSPAFPSKPYSQGWCARSGARKSEWARRAGRAAQSWWRQALLSRGPPFAILSLACSGVLFRHRLHHHSVQWSEALAIISCSDLTPFWLARPFLFVVLSRTHRLQHGAKSSRGKASRTSEACTSSSRCKARSAQGMLKQGLTACAARDALDTYPLCTNRVQLPVQDARALIHSAWSRVCKVMKWSWHVQAGGCCGSKPAVRSFL